MNKERLAIFVLAFALGLASLAVGLGWYRQQQVVTLRARLPEQGGWLPGELDAVVGQPFRLNLTSDDVLHSFAVGKVDMPPVDIYPGEVSEVTLTFDQPGKYTYYCTRWCGPDHWRMRGTIEVIRADTFQVDPATPGNPPLYQQLGLDIDAPHPARVTPEAKPASASNTGLANLPEEFTPASFYRANSPVEAWEALRTDPSTRDLSDQQVWSLVAAVWQSNTSQPRLAEGKALYTRNCAACHGQDGSGGGVFAERVSVNGEMAEMGAAEPGLKTPADFTDPGKLLGASPALLHGKILRGGMGTGMPYWGPIFTEEQLWSLVDYLWSFQFDYAWEVAR